jgi:hypothetical protein
MAGISNIAIKSTASIEDLEVLEDQETRRPEGIFREV